MVLIFVLFGNNGGWCKLQTELAREMRHEINHFKRSTALIDTGTHLALVNEPFSWEK